MPTHEDPVCHIQTSHVPSCAGPISHQTVYRLAYLDRSREFIEVQTAKESTKQ